MGENAAQTVTEIEQTRERIEHNLRELEERLPPPAVLGKRAIGIVVGGGMTGTLALAAIKRMRRKRARKHPAKDAQTTVIQVIPEGLAESLRNGPVAKAVKDGEWKPWVAGAAAAWFLMRAAELRRLRRLNRALLDR
jgi:hypothetical protein